MEQEPGSKRQRTVAGLPVCSLFDPCRRDHCELRCHTQDRRQTSLYDHKTGERLSPHLVNVGRQVEHEAMTRHQLFARVPIAMARGSQMSMA